MNRRRQFLVGLAALYAAPVLAQAPERAGKLARVGIFERTSRDKYQDREQPFVETLRELGWVESRNIAYDRVYADDDAARLPALAAALVARGPNVIYTLTAESGRAAIAVTRTIPIVLGSANQFVERGWVQSLARPGGNVTGIQHIGPELGAKRSQLLRLALPKITRVGVLVVGATNTRELNSIEQVAATLGVKVTAATMKHAGELDLAFASLTRSRVEVVLTTHNELFLSERRRILDLAAKQRIPVIGHRSEMADDGALMSYSSMLTEQIRRAAHIVDKILKGAKPGEIPVEAPTRYELVVNLKTAKTLGITVPREILAQTDRVIE